MKFTLLEMVQEILQSMESDEVNSIDDTVESYAVAVLIRSVFYDLAIDLGLPEHEGLFELIASGDSTKPVLMTVPSGVSLVRNIKYNNKLTSETYANYKEVSFKNFEDFLVDQTTLTGQSSNVGQMTFTSNGDSFEVMYRTDKMPQFYTTMDDNQLIFDSYDSTEDTTLQKSKTMCMGVIYPTFDLTDNFTPDIDPPQFSLLKNRAKVRAFAELKQAQNAEAAGEARRQKIIVQKRKETISTEPFMFKVPRRFGRVGPRLVNIPKSLKQGV
jgi:hypothetical protein